MQISKLFLTFMGVFYIGAVNAANITIFYSPTCPHCHHALDFIGSQLVYEYDNLTVSKVNVTNADNRQMFIDALYKCGYRKGGVPVLVVGDKCFQGYSDAMQEDLRGAIEIGMSDEEKTGAANNKSAMNQDKAGFVAAHPDRKNAITEYSAKKN